MGSVEVIISIAADPSTDTGGLTAAAQRLVDIGPHYYTGDLSQALAGAEEDLNEALRIVEEFVSEAYDAEDEARRAERNG